MNKQLVFSCLLAIAGGMFCIKVDAAEPAFQFKLRSHEGREWSETDFNDRKLVVVAFLGTECPLVKLYGPRLQQLSEDYDGDVAVIGVNANTQDSLTEMSAYAERHGVKFPLLKDVGNVVADRFQAKRTPEVFLLDADRQIRYRGMIDDQYGVGLIRDKAEQSYLRDAIEELLAGKAVSVPETEAVGCHIGRVSKVRPTGDITYSNQIVRIFNRRCIECHREGQLAPFTLTSYDDIVGWEDTICEVIEDNRMPPWFANPEHGRFSNDCRLSNEEKELVYQWVENGMPEGDAADLPEPPQFAEGWGIPEPDQIFYMRDEPFEVQAQGTIDYQHFVVDPGWTEDKYICAAEARPDNKSVVHHILVYVLPKGQNTRNGLDQVLVGYAPGGMPLVLEDGVAAKVEAGSKLMFQMHYTPNGYVEKDRSYAAVKFMDKNDVKKVIRGRVAIKPRLRIPPHADAHAETAEYRVSRDEVLVSMTPHMHLRGKSFKYEATFPNGDRETLLDIPRYDFNWQLKYILDEPRLLPRGTVVKCTAVYDNSAENLANPDPTRTVTWGDQSWEEMMIGFFATLPADKTDPIKSNPEIDPSGVYAWKGASPGQLTLTLEDDILAGSLQSQGATFQIEEAVVQGDKLEFLVDVGEVLLEFQATATSDSLRGKIIWTAQSAGRSGYLPWAAKRTQ